MFDTNELLKDGFESINVTHSNNLSTFVPKPFFNEDNLSDYLQYNIKILKNDFIAHDLIENSELVNVYIPFGYINNYLFDTFGSFEYKHTSTVLVENLLKETSNSESEKLYVYVEKDVFQIVVIKEKKMEFFNTFNHKTKEDFIYYILFVTEQLNLNPEKLLLYFINDIEKESELYKIVYKYIKNVHFFKPKYIIPKKLNLSNHSYYTLINQY